MADRPSPLERALDRVGDRWSLLVVEALLDGRVKLAMDNLPPYLVFLASGAVRGLAVTSAERCDWAPDLPTVAEQGYPDFEATHWWYLAAPAGIRLALVRRLSDALVRRGVSRATLAIGWLLLALVLFQVLAAGVTSAWALAILTCLLGTSINLFTLISAAIAETYGTQRTASIVSFVNTVAQLFGATALAVSGYVGVSMGAEAGHGLAEYRGVWLTAMAGTGATALAGAIMHVMLARGAARVTVRTLP